ncbi:hypothetical protein SUGI_0204810 [Cryptomeria japonica]|uniref:lipase-like PAD4 n=1 Tax=Cryptomeria japonica TaxID=3369 RepID=UPI002408E453|nr:lipase-like PAD4 [Cryptomeria japonica]GLJ13080.1 hypothetical protein SUGI_0204810 [Cryptomeria japonica]
MEACTSNPKPGETLDYVVGSELIADVWDACCKAYKCRDFHETEIKKNVIIIAFCGSQKVTDFITENDFDECKINSYNQHFESMHDGDVENSKPALVRKLFLDRFLCMMQSSKLGDKIQQYQTGKKTEKVTEKKTVILAGHSFGGAIASLWTLWALEQRWENSPLCITFGCPLLGDKIFSRAIEREKWSPYFCHIVSRHDIVPRLCFSSLKSLPISKALDRLLPYWNDSMQKGDNQQKVQDGSHALPQEDSLSFIKQVIADTSQLVTHETRALVVGSANLVGGAVKCLIKRSPYRPFGYYVFCSSSGTACCIENTEAILQMLYFALGNSRQSGACIMEHIEYGKTIAQISKSSSLIPPCWKTVNNEIPPYWKKNENFSTDEVALALQLEAMGIGVQNVQAWLGLKIVEENKNKLTKNMDQQIIKLDEMQNYMAELELYKISCEKDGSLGYYDFFKMNWTKELPNDLPNDVKWINANKNRFKLAAFWDGICELMEKEELPNDLPNRVKWINAGTEYRLLVEPLDIAHYYRLGKHEDSGHYIAHGRPRRYKLLQKWLEDKEKKGEMQSKKRIQPAIFTQDSCFWARVEEVHSKTDEEKTCFTEQLKQKMADCELSKDVFLDDNTFMRWWKSYPNLSAQEKQSFSYKYPVMLLPSAEG